MDQPKKTKPKALLKVLTVANILNQAISRIQFTGNWFAAFKQPQDRGFWFVYGVSGSGKSTFVMMLSKALALLGYNVLYNMLEEDLDDTDFIDRVKLCEMNDVKDNFWARSYNYNELFAYLKKTPKINVIIIDSATYFFENFEQYLEFKKMFKNKIVIVTGHATGKNPRSKLEEDINFNAKMKIYVNGYLALCKGRTIGPNGGRFIIYKEGYDLIHGTNN